VPSDAERFANVEQVDDVSLVDRVDVEERAHALENFATGGDRYSCGEFAHDGSNE